MARDTIILLLTFDISKFLINELDADKIEPLAENEIGLGSLLIFPRVDTVIGWM